MKLGIFAILAVMIVTAPYAALAGWRSIDIPDCFGSEFIDDFTLDSRGNIWIAAPDVGVAVYDGLHCRLYGIVESGGTDVYGIAEDRTGTMWLSTYDGLFSYDGATWTNHPTPFPSAGGLGVTVPVVFIDRAGRIWLGSAGRGAACYDGAGWTVYTTADGLVGNRIAAILQDTAGDLWFGTHDGVSRFDGVVWTTYTAADGLAGNYITDIEEDLNGQLWFATCGNGVSRFDGMTWTTIRQSDGLPGECVNDILADRSGNVWFGTSRGIARYDGARWNSFTTEDGLLDDYVTRLRQDPSGNILVGTAEGLSLYDGVGWAQYRAVDGLANDCVWSVLCASDGDLWFGSYGWGVSRLDSTGWTTYTIEDGLACNWVYDVCEDHRGRIWFGTMCGGSCFDETGWVTYTTADGLGDDSVRDVFEDSSGKIWFATETGGVSCYDGRAWITYPVTLEGGYPVEVRSIAEDADGSMWFATWGGGAWRYDGAAWETYTPATTDGGLPGYSVDCILRDSAGALWFGTIHGLARYDGAHWTPYWAGDGQPVHSFKSLYEDRLGNIWSGTGEGVLRFDGEIWGGYGKNDGLVSHEILSITEGVDGDLWFGTELGVTRHTPDRVPPRPVFVSLLPAVSSSPVQDLMYTAAYEGALGVEFSYSFDGSPWSEWAPANYWLASNLSDGEHIFRLSARDKLGNVSPLPAVCTFEIDATAPSPVLASPTFGQAVKDSVVLVGTAADLRFRKYVIEVRPNGAASWQTLIQSESSVVEGVLCGWNTSFSPDGEYELRLCVTDTLGLTGSYPVRVIVDNHAPWADKTAPAEVRAATGGDIYTTGEEVHLYFAPRAFGEDTEVNIVALADTDVPDILENGASRVMTGYEISWENAVLAKPATLEMSCAASLGCELLTPPAPRTLAIYFSGPDRTWRPLGGTLDGSLERISCAVGEPGRYAVYADVGGVFGPSTLSDLSVTPRVFSPQGGFASDEAAIGFTIGGPGPVTVKIYNRAGRLVREVSSGQQMNAGANLVRWDGRDAEANLVQDGVYLVVVEALGQKEVKTLAVVR